MNRRGWWTFGISVPAFCLVTTFNACSKLRAPVSLANLPSLSQTGSGAELYTKNCSGCHSPLNASAKLGRTAAQITAAVSSVPQMIARFGTTLSASDINAIAFALQVQTAPPAGATVAAYPLGDRTHMASVFSEIFVESANPDPQIRNLIDSLIRSQVISLNGPCRRYDASCPGYEARGTGHVEADFAEIPVLPSSGTLRSGYLLRACKEILSLDLAVTTPLKKSGNLTVASAGNDANLSAVYGTFFPGFTPQTQSLTDLKALHSAVTAAGRSTTDAWRMVLYVMCTDSQMEML